MKSKKGGSFALWLGLSTLLVFSQAASATILAPGSTAAPSILGPGPGSTLLASLDSGPVPVSNTDGSITLTYDVVSAVYADPLNTFGAGDLDFVYQVTNVAGNDTIGRVTAGVFSGFQTDVGFTLTGSAIPGGLFADGNQAPDLVNRNLSGATVGFIYNPSFFGPGTESNALIIETDATKFKPGNVNLIDDLVASTAAFEPAAAVPEPISLLPLVGGLLALGAVRIRRSRA